MGESETITDPFSIPMSGWKPGTSEHKEYERIVLEKFNKELASAFERGFKMVVISDNRISLSLRELRTEEELAAEFAGKPYYVFEAPPIVLPDKPSTMEQYIAAIQAQAKRKGWSDNITWMERSVFQEVGELVTEIEKIRSTWDITPDEAARIIATTLGIEDMQTVEVSNDLEDAYLVKCSFDYEVEVLGSQIKRIEKDTGYEVYRMSWGTEGEVLEEVFEISFSRPKNPFLKLVGESSDIDYFKWQLIKKVARDAGMDVNLDYGMIDKINDNEVKKKKTIDASGKMVRK